MAALLALLSSMLWGISDFTGGAVSRRLPVPSVLGLSQLAALLLLLPLAVATGAFDAPRTYLVPGLVAGVVGITALAAFFRALSLGTMGVVAPIAALGVSVPVIAGLLRGEQPSMLQVIGMVMAIIGVVLASGPELSGRAGLQPLLLAVVAAIGFGVVLLLVAVGSEGDPGAVIMTLLTMRLAGVAVLAGLLLAFARRRGLDLGVRRTDLPILLLIGACDVSANGAYAVASRSSLVSVAAVLASLYPVVTALLAYRFLGERLRRIQVVGVAVTLSGVLVLAGA
ncbi:MAG: DMT family transporter [Mycobacteriales bacterium]